MSLVDQYKEDRTMTKAMVEATFRRDNVPEELITKYFDCYDKETEQGVEIAQWLDDNRPETPDEEDAG